MIDKVQLLRELLDRYNTISDNKRYKDTWLNLIGEWEFRSCINWCEPCIRFDNEFTNVIRELVGGFNSYGHLSMNQNSEIIKPETIIAANMLIEYYDLKLRKDEIIRGIS